MNSQILKFRLCMLSLFLLGNTVQLNAQNVSLEWAKQIRGRASSNISGQGNSIIADDSGNVYTAGNFAGTLDFDPGTGVVDLTSGSPNWWESDVFISKLDAAGNYVWAKQFKGNGSTSCTSVDRDADGNIITTGIFNATTDFDPGAGSASLTAAGSYDAYVCKLNPAGEFMWVKHISGPDLDFSQQLVTDDSGHIYVTGFFSGTVNFGQGSGSQTVTAIGSQDIFVCKLDASGNFVWVKQVGGPGASAFAYDIALDASNNVYTTGGFGSTVDFDPGTGAANLTATNTSGSYYDVFVSKLNSSGEYVWAKQIGGAASVNVYSNSIAVDPSGNAYITGSFDQTVDFNPGSGTYNLTAAGDQDIFVCKLNTAGDLSWAKQMRGTPTFYGSGTSIALDAAGNPYTAGYFLSTVDFDPGSATANLSVTGGGIDIFISKLDTAGNYRWAKQLGGVNFNFGQSVAVDRSGNVYTTGSFGDTSDFDPGPNRHELVAIGGPNPFIHKMSCSDTSSSILSITACSFYTLNGETYAESGTYVQKIPNKEGCDSTITLHLTIAELDPVINVDGFVLSTTQPYTTYQWLLNGMPIPGAVNPTYTVIQNGDYTVVVANDSGCVDTSEVYTVNNVNINQPVTETAQQIKIYPNPAADVFYVLAPVPVHILISGIEGKTIRTVEDATAVSVKDLAAGIYLIRITNKQGDLIKTEKLIRPDKP